MKNQYSKEIELSEKLEELLCNEPTHIEKAQVQDKIELDRSNKVNELLLSDLIIGYSKRRKLPKIEIYNEEYVINSIDQEIDIINKKLEQNGNIPQEEKIFVKDIKSKLDLFLSEDLTIEELEEVLEERITEVIKEIELLKELLKQRLHKEKAYLEANKKFKLASSVEELLRNELHLLYNYYKDYHPMIMAIATKMKVDELKAAIQTTLKTIEEKSKYKEALILSIEKISLSLERLKESAPLKIAPIDENLKILKVELDQLNCKIEKAEEIEQYFKLLFYVFYKKSHLCIVTHQEYKKAEWELKILRKRQLVYKKLFSILKAIRQVEVLYNTYQDTAREYDFLYNMESFLEQSEQKNKISEQVKERLNKAKEKKSNLEDRVLRKEIENSKLTSKEIIKKGEIAERYEQAKHASEEALKKYIELKESVQGIKLIEAYIGYRKALNEENNAREEFINSNKELIELKTELEEAKINYDIMIYYVM